MVDLAVSLKRTEHVNQNFLIAQEPEFISYLPLYDGTRRLNYPDRLKRLRLAVVLFPQLEGYDSLKDETIRAKIEHYNSGIREKNEMIREAFSDYPYKVEFVPYQPESAIYKQGFQYVMYHLHSTIGTMREILGYEEEQEEVVSQITTKEGRKALQTYQMNATAYKWYIKQVVVSDVYTGRYWDASPDFRTSLESFVIYFRQSLDK
jgi:hypothetical protein